LFTPTLILKKRLYYSAIAVAICLLIGFLSSTVTQSSIVNWYPSLNKPSFNPPNWIFAPVWSVLYILMGIAAGLVWARGFHHIWVKTALYHFIFQLLFNALWSIVFFGLQEPFWALLVIFTLLILIILTIKWFKVVHRTAALLMIPYLLWVCFATVLNYKIWELN
jgi:tryptophan-rich sensory protein